MEVRKDWTKLVEYTVGSLSICGCVFILLVFLCYRKLRNFSFELVAYLTFSSMLNTISYLINYIDVEDRSKEINETACKIQAFLMVLFENSQYIWAMLIAYYIYKSVVYFDENQNKSHTNTRIEFLLVGYIVPLIMALVGLWRGVYGVSGKWCWFDTVSNNLESDIFSFVFYFIIWLLIFLNFAFNYRVISYLNRESHSEIERERLNRYHKKLMIYPIIQIVCIFPGTINRFLEIFLNKSIYALQMGQIIFLLLQGFLYAIVYGYTNQVKIALRRSFENICQCCCVNRNGDSVISANTQKLNEGTISNFSSDSSYVEQISNRIGHDL